jgi:intraflagellar transport protein 46
MQSSVVVRSIRNASDNKEEIDKWIRDNNSNTNQNQPVSNEVMYQNRMPSVEMIMKLAWPKETGDDEEGINEGTNLDIPMADIDLSVDEYARLLCSLLGIPVYNGCMIDSVHLLLSLFVELTNSRPLAVAPMFS